MVRSKKNKKYIFLFSGVMTFLAIFCSPILNFSSKSHVFATDTSVHLSSYTQTITVPSNQQNFSTLFCKENTFEGKEDKKRNSRRAKFVVSSLEILGNTFELSYTQRTSVNILLNFNYRFENIPLFKIFHCWKTHLFC